MGCMSFAVLDSSMRGHMRTQTLRQAVRALAEVAGLAQDPREVGRERDELAGRDLALQGRGGRCGDDDARGRFPGVAVIRPGFGLALSASHSEGRGIASSRAIVARRRCLETLVFMLGATWFLRSCAHAEIHRKLGSSSRRSSSCPQPRLACGRIEVESPPPHSEHIGMRSAHLAARQKSVVSQKRQREQLRLSMDADQSKGLWLYTAASCS